MAAGANLPPDREDRELPPSTYVRPTHSLPREPPIRHRRNIPAAWLEIMLTEGGNRQVRRMTAAVGHPTLRLVRVSIGPWSLDGLRPGEWKIRRQHKTTA